MMGDSNISSATSTSQISSLILSHRLSSAAASISSSSCPGSPFRAVPDDHWARQLIFPTIPSHRPPAISHPSPGSGGAAGTADGGRGAETATALLGFDPGALLQSGEKTFPAAAAGADFECYDGESEEGGEASEDQKRAPPRSGSKRSRAAEVHNLSEKRRRSRINEKMKALQNLIPNSNKTDKASMLDEAIEYLKQLQLQVQMLSMRNGLNLQTMYLPGTLPALQSSHMSHGSLIDMGVGMIPSSHDSSIHHPSFDIAKHGSSSHQQMIPALASLGIEGSPFPPFPFPVPDEGILDATSAGSLPGGSQQPQGGVHAGKQHWKV